MRPSWNTGVIVAGGFSAAIGAALGHWAWPRDARAEPASSGSTVYVPSGGLVFRTLDGRPILRLSREAAGGVLELYDDEEQVTSRITAVTPSIPKARSADCACGPTPQSVMLDDLDPWAAHQTRAPQSVTLDEGDPWKERQ
ncbi:MAG TPA: hypothetical protein VEK07_05005 [Polyangiaceae bacterium]|nr:hypothetical protein [Polyangiaceae bacterium]